LTTRVDCNLAAYSSLMIAKEMVDTCATKPNEAVFS
jgi:hypothetical protein